MIYSDVGVLNQRRVYVQGGRLPSGLREYGRNSYYWDSISIQLVVVAIYDRFAYRGWLISMLGTLTTK